MFVVIGWVVVLVCVFGVFIAHGGNMGPILKALPWEMAMIGGATLGAFLVNNQMKVIKATMKGLGACFKGSKYSKARYMELLALLFDILQKARKEGLMAIEKDVEAPHESEIFKKYPTVGSDHHVIEFTTDYLRMMVSGNLNSHEIEALMDSEIDTHHQEAHAPVAALARLAGALPAFGIVAAVLGVVNTMGSVGQPPAVLGAMRYVATASPAFVDRHFSGGVGAGSLAQAPSLRFNTKDELQARWVRRLCHRHVELPRHTLPSPQAFVVAAVAGMGWGLQPEALIRAQLKTGALVELVPESALDVPLHWQQARAASTLLDGLTRQVVAAARKVLIPT